jgi:hypothetical protein
VARAAGLPPPLPRLPKRTRTTERLPAPGRSVVLARVNALARADALRRRAATAPPEPAAPPAPATAASATAAAPVTAPAPVTEAAIVTAPVTAALPEPAALPPAAAARRASPTGEVPPPVAAPGPDVSANASAPAPAPAARRRRRPALLVSLAVVAAAGVIAAVMAWPAPAGGASSGQAAFAAVPSRDSAAAWVAARISRSSIVACDPVMCSDLHGRGVPAADLLVLRAGAPGPLRAGVVVATPAVRSELGARLPGVYAPAVLARFGTGPGAVDVRVVAPGGAAAYQAALARDEQARQRAAAQVLGNRGLLLSAAARVDVAAGRVDSRLLLALPALAAVHPVQVLAFAGTGPGADPGLPLSSAELSAGPPGAGLPAAAYTTWLLGWLASQRPPFRPVAANSGRTVTVTFSGPPPLGLTTG